MILWHVAYGGHHLDSEKPVAESVSDALELYGWYRVVQADDELDAVQLANKEANDAVDYGEVYFVTPFESKPTRKMEVLVRV